MPPDPFTSAVGLAALIRAGETTAAEVTEAALRRIEALQPVVGAFVDFDGDRALAAARDALPGPLSGVPVAVKANTAVRGLVCDHGSALLGDHRPDHDAFLVRRLREAGAIVVGTTKLPEFGILPTTEPRHGGPARNPWDLGRTPGGSSGGSAAAVAAGMVTIAHGNDGGGSIRIPAACCGLVGLKPTRGRISRGPDGGDSFLGVEGVLTRTVADTALGLDILCGYEVGDPTWVPRPVIPFSAVAGHEPGRLRIAVSASNALGVPVHEESITAVREISELLAGLGHHVEEVDPPLPGPEVLGDFVNVFATARAADIEAAVGIVGHDPGEDEIEPLSDTLRRLALGLPASGYLRTVTGLQRLGRDLVAFFAGWDLLMTPVIAERPLAVGECHGWMDDPAGGLGRGAQFAPYPGIYNVTGQPAISVPAGFGADGLPNAVQIAAAPLAEDTLLQVATQIEAARPWADRRPDLG
jgi:amidase